MENSMDMDIPYVSVFLFLKASLTRSKNVNQLMFSGVSVDFFNKDDDILDPYSNLHIEEERLVRENPLQVQ